MQLIAEKGDFFLNKKRPKRDPKNGLGLLRNPGLPKRDPVGSSATANNSQRDLRILKKRPKREPFFLKKRPKRDL